MVNQTGLSEDTPGDSIALCVLAVRQQNVRCRESHGTSQIILRTSDTWKIFPGEIITVQGHRQWRYAGHTYLTGTLLDQRLDATALGLEPLALKEMGLLDFFDEPANANEDDEDAERDARFGQTVHNECIQEDSGRPLGKNQVTAFEMIQILPGMDSEDPSSDPIVSASGRNEAGDYTGARKLLMDLLEKDLRCLDAHAHLGNFAFERWPKDALRHYEAGVRIGELSLGASFAGALPWRFIDNRPFLRCLNGYGLCLWRLGRFEQATAVFKRMLRFNPDDNQGARILLKAVRAAEPWEALVE
jgi:tetratricopeptide (TPR) repeat protein